MFNVNTKGCQWISSLDISRSEHGILLIGFHKAMHLEQCNSKNFSFYKKKNCILICFEFYVLLFFNYQGFDNRAETIVLEIIPIATTRWLQSLKVSLSNIETTNSQVCLRAHGRSRGVDYWLYAFRLQHMVGYLSELGARWGTYSVHLVSGQRFGC